MANIVLIQFSQQEEAMVTAEVSEGPEKGPEKLYYYIMFTFYWTVRLIIWYARAILWRFSIVGCTVCLQVNNNTW